MNPSIPAYLASLITAMSLLSVAVSAQSTGKPANPLPIAVVEVDKVVQHTKAYAKSQEMMRAMAKEFNSKLTELENDIEALRISIKPMRQSAAKVQKTLELKTMLFQRQEADKAYNGAVQIAKIQRVNAMYEEAQAAIQALAKKRGILLVIRKNGQRSIEDLLESKTARSEAEAVRMQSAWNRERAVLYAAASLDITEDVVKTLKAVKTTKAK